MSGPKQSPASSSLRVRRAAVSGQFYPDDSEACRALAKRYVEEATIDPEWIGRPLAGGIVPHAGWICSAAIAGKTIAAIARSRVNANQTAPEVVILFGAVHSAEPLERAALDSHALWRVPSGDMAVARELVQRLAELPGGRFEINDRFHELEHAIEVELPLIQCAWPEAKLLPIEVPAVTGAVEIGIETARLVAATGLSAVYLASSDLTHYGPAYGFTPAGVGLAALEWAIAHDRKLLAKVVTMEVEAIVPEAQARMNACGGGAIAAMLAACREQGATRGRVLAHTNSYQTLADTHPQRPENAVGYAAVVVG